MEVIARKKRGLSGVYIFSAVLSCLLIILGALSMIFAPLDGIVALLGGIILLIVSIHIYKKVQATPEVIISFDGVRLICTDGSFLIDEVQNIAYDFARGGKSYYRYKWGKLSIFINGEKHVYDFVEDVEQVQTR